MAFVFLKLGGSLITDKSRPFTPRLEKLDELSAQIAAARQERPNLRLVLGHGSGSFGHAAAQQYHFHNRAETAEDWRGFAEVWYQAATLNRLVIESLHRAGLPVIALPPIASVCTHEGKVFIWDLYYLQAALNANLIPVVYGDVVFDQALGGVIVSTETLFAHLARSLKPERILLAGQEEGVWERFPQRTRLIKEITPQMFASQHVHLGESAGTDVTGGMRSKVEQMLELVQEMPSLQVVIFSGETSENVRRALLGEMLGSVLHA